MTATAGNPPASDRIFSSASRRIIPGIGLDIVNAIYNLSI
jgi:hypothetical protein